MAAPPVRVISTMPCLEELVITGVINILSILLPAVMEAPVSVGLTGFIISGQSVLPGFFSNGEVFYFQTQVLSALAN